MASKVYIPYTSSIRHVCLVDRSKLWTGSSIKQLVVKKHKVYRSSNFFRSSVIGVKRYYRVLDLYRNDHLGIPGLVYRIEYDPNRSAFISLLLYKNNICTYVLCPSSVSLGDIFVNYLSVPMFFNIGDCFSLHKIPVGSIIHNLELKCGFGGKYIRSAGSFGMVFKKLDSLNIGIIQLRSGFRKIVSLDCRATLGMVSNKDNWLVLYGKAGRCRWIGKKSIVRGVAMNPIDHPHGGGEGKKSKRADPRNIWGKVFKWRRTSV
jgi:large subunit ribosomal protein L2